MTCRLAEPARWDATTARSGARCLQARAPWGGSVRITELDIYLGVVPENRKENTTLSRVPFHSPSPKLLLGKYQPCVRRGSRGRVASSFRAMFEPVLVRNERARHLDPPKVRHQRLSKESVAYSGDVSTWEKRGARRVSKLDMPAMSLRGPLSRTVTGEMAVTRPSPFGTTLPLSDDVAGEVSDSEETFAAGMLQKAMDFETRALRNDHTLNLHDGTISKSEFARAVPAPGIEGPEADALFDSFDPDGSGTIEYTELSMLPRRQVRVRAPSSRL